MVSPPSIPPSPSSQLVPATPGYVIDLLDQFWQSMAKLPDLLVAGETLGAGFCLTQIRRAVLGCMVALNGAQLPGNLAEIECYLGPSQRAALLKTFLTPSAERKDWIGQAVALTVIYRWYAPQLAEKFGISVPTEQENQVLADLLARIPEWPAAITTEA